MSEKFFFDTIQFNTKLGVFLYIYKVIASSLIVEVIRVGHRKDVYDR